jgi:aminoglycoside 6'-N-acetyltransferase I
VSEFRVRLAQLPDGHQLARLRAALWPESSVEEHAQEVTAILAGTFSTTMPLVVFVSEANDDVLTGFLEAGLRSCADGCNRSRPVGYVEGWYVVRNCRRQGIGSALVRAAEDWARSMGCTEMASDTQIDNHLSQRAHEAVGFKTTERSVLYRKSL